MEGYGVGEVARMAGISVRTLHHYDRIGLLRPSLRTLAGYRRYTGADLDRLQQVLGYRELGLGLAEVADLLAGGDPVRHLRRQRDLIRDRMKRLTDLARAVNTTLEALQMGINLTPEERLAVFGGHDPAQYVEEVEQRWADTDAYRESHRRTSSYTKADWERIATEGAAVEHRLASALAAGLPANSAEAMDAAEAHRQHICGSFYDCGHEMHRGLAQMYLADPRFTQHYEDVAPGLAQYVHDAITANADRAGS
jgi:MerR family transcriptional regulator, thiopeptide resistance regulator